MEDLFGPKQDEPMNARHKKYLKFKQENPDVMKIIWDICVNLIKKDRRFSLRGVIYVVRFEKYFHGYRDEPYRICDHHSPYLARELMAEYPQVAKLIRMIRVEGESEEDFHARMEGGETT